MVPVARDEPGLDRALVQREAEVRAAILDRVRRVVVPEHDDGQRADLRERAGPSAARSASVPARTSSVGRSWPDPFRKCLLAIIYPDGCRQDVKHANLGTTQAPDRRAAEARRRDGRPISRVALDMTEAGVRQHLDALAENGLVVSRTRPGRGSRPAADRVDAHRSRAGSVPRSPRRPHRRSHHRGAHRARRQGSAAGDRRARRGATRRVRTRDPEARLAARARRSARARADRRGLPRRGRRRSRRQGRAARRTPLPDLHRGDGVPRVCAARSSSCSAR